MNKGQGPRTKGQTGSRGILAVLMILMLLGTWNLALGPSPALAQTAPQGRIGTEVVLPGQALDEQVEGRVRGKVRDLADYIGLIYRFLISIVGVVAGVMIMVGGFQYLTAGGDKTKVDAGKEKITNAVAGLVLALSAYLILNTINPNLVNLKVPSIRTVLPESMPNLLLGSGGPCNSDAECQAGYFCAPIYQDTPVTGAIKKFVTASLFAATLPTGIASAAATSGAKVVAWWWGRGLVIKSITAAGAGAAASEGYDAWKTITNQNYKGVCALEARDQPDNSICIRDSNCASGKCLKDAAFFSFYSGQELAGICTSGANRSYCRTADDCKNKLPCVELAQGFRACSDGNQGSYCDSTCNGDLVCRKIGGVGRCSKHSQGELGDYCVADQDCWNYNIPQTQATKENPQFYCAKPPGKEVPCLPSSEGWIDASSCFCLVRFPEDARRYNEYCYTNGDCGAGRICAASKDGPRASKGSSPEFGYCR